MSWWIWLIGSVVFAAGCLFLYWQDTSLSLSHYTVTPRDLPEELDGLRIVQLSDLHNMHFGKKQVRLLEKVKALSPDLIVLTGDLADKRRTRDERFLPAKELAEGLVKIAPVYAIMGNHETEKERIDSMTAVLTACGVTVLHNTAVPVLFGGYAFMLLGAADIAESWALFPDDPEKGDEAHAKALQTLCTQAEGFSILLSHRPHLISMYKACGVSLIFSGHAHGGQVRLPFIGGLFAPEQGIFPKYTAGVHNLGNAHLVISRGLGNSRFPFRVFNRPEILSAELKKI